MTPTIQISGDVLYGDKIIRLKLDAATHVAGDRWHLIYSGIDINPLNTTFARVRVSINKPDALEAWEQSTARKSKREKLLTSIKLG